MEVTSASDIYNLLNNRKIYIYGTGFVGKRFFHVLQMKGIDEKVNAFITTNGTGNCFCGKKIKAIYEILPLRDNEVICVSVTHASFGEIKRELKELNVENYIWIFPYLYELFLGDKVHEKISLPLASVWYANRERIGIAVRYLALEEFYGKNKIGYDLYKKVMNLCSTEDTSTKRLKAYKEMIMCECHEDCQPDEPISIMENGLIVDGIHRTTIALFHGKEKILVDVYPNSETYADEYLKWSNPLFSVAVELGFNNDELKAIMDIKNILDKKYLEFE